MNTKSINFTGGLGGGAGHRMQQMWQDCRYHTSTVNHVAASNHPSMDGLTDGGAIGHRIPGTDKHTWAASGRLCTRLRIGTWSGRTPAGRSSSPTRLNINNHKNSMFAPLVCWCHSSNVSDFFFSVRICGFPFAYLPIRWLMGDLISQFL